MPCHTAVLKNVLTISPEDVVEDALKALHKQKISVAPVVDDNGILVGLFSMRSLLKNLIPVQVAMNDGVTMDIKVGAAPGVAKRLQKVKPLKVLEIMERKVETVRPDDPIWEGVSCLTKQDDPVAVVDESHKFVGLMTHASMIQELEDIQNREE